MKKKIDYTYHSHTWRCGHASGTDEEYVLSALENGYKILGFSDHVMLPGASQPGIRGEYSLFQGYVDSVRELQTRYKGRLVIHLGFEAEWYGDLYRDYYHDLLKSKKIDYLILGQHCYLEDGHFRWYASGNDKVASLKHYVHDVIEGMKTGLFTYVAHPDHFMSWYGKWDDHTLEAARAIAKASKELGVPLEVNMGPSRWGRRNKEGEAIDVAYPCPQFWDVVGEVGSLAIIGVDDHDPSELKNSPFEWVISFVEKHNLNYIDRVQIKPRG